MRGLHIGIALAAAAVVATPAFVVAQEGGPADGALVAAAGWRDVVDGQRAPQVPPAGDTESAIVLLDGPGLVDIPEADRAAALDRMQAAQLAVEGSLQGMGGVVTHRYRTLVNGLAVRLPSGRLSTAAEVPGIQAVVPVLFMSPAQALPGRPLPTADGPQGSPSTTSTPSGTPAAPAREPAPSAPEAPDAAPAAPKRAPAPSAPSTTAPDPATTTPDPARATPPDSAPTAPPRAAQRPVHTPGAGSSTPAKGPRHIALIDSAVDVSHPWLGGGIGPSNLIIGGADLVEGDADPSPDPTDPAAESHGTQMASIVLRSPALAGLPAAATPRMLVYRVTAREMVDGRVRTLARTDRVLAALEIAMDPNRDGSLGDAADVLLLGVARGFGAGGVDPVARSLAAANRAGAVVVAPAGNDGPTGGTPGTLGNAAAMKDVLVVGGMAGGTAPRTADLTMSIGPAAARLGPLPLMGAEPSDSLRAGLRLVAASGDAGVGTGTDVRDFAGEGGRSTVAGAVAMVTRSGAPIAEVARRAAGAGALALVVWDEDGTGAFPGIVGGADVPIPIIGLGPRQGTAVLEMLTRDPAASVSVVPRGDQGASAAVASFSSRGPTADGRLKPDVVAPAIAVEAAYPGRDEAGNPRQAPLSGTSGAAASVAATALRLRVDHPSWRPADIRSVIVQSAGPVPAAALADAGAGSAPDPGSISTRALPGIAIDPPILSGIRRRDDDTTLKFSVRDLTGTGGPYRMLLQGPDGDFRPVGEPIVLAPGGRAAASIAVPRAPRSGYEAWRGRLVIAPQGGDIAAGTAVVWAAPRVAVPKGALGTPEVQRTGSGLGQVVVRVGMRDVTSEGLTVATLRDVRIDLAPVGGGEPIRMTQGEPSGDWPASTYRILLSRRSATGPEVPAGRYRAVVTATDANGAQHRSRSAPFDVGG